MIVSKTKICSKCKIEKNENDFNKNKSKKDGLHNQCKECRNQYYKKNKYEILINNKQYYKENRNKILNQINQYQEQNKKGILNKKKQYYKENKETILIKSKECYRENKDKRLKYAKKYRDSEVSFDIFAIQINWCELVRRNKNDKNILEVKCAYCGKWYIPRLSEIINRISAINNNFKGEMRFYCSNECKYECPVYRQQKYPKGFKLATSREVQPELRQMVLKRDIYTCQKCGSKKSLHCHHVEGIRWEPLESADIDKCITLCKECHKKVHKKEGCGYNDMKCEVI